MPRGRLHSCAAALVLALCRPARAAAAPPVAPPLYAIDGDGRAVGIAGARASLERTPPALAGEAADHDPDALRYLMAEPRQALPTAVEIVSTDARGAPLDRLIAPLSPCACPPSVAPGLACAATLPIRAVSDAVDRDHPLARARSILAELGGALSIRRDGRELGRAWVTGPRSLPKDFATAGADLSSGVDRLRAKLRFVMVRLSPHGSLPVGADRAEAIGVAQAAVARANALWGSCGISFGAPEQAAVEIVDPPPAHLIAVGCAHGLVASGGALSVSIRGKTVRAPIDAGMVPRAAARRLAAAIERAGFSARVSDNTRIGAGAYPTADVLVRTKRGKLVEVSPPPSGAVSSDATLQACIGAVDLEDGLSHFEDVDAAVGTIEERSLIKAYDDLDPTTIDVYIVPGFAQGGRIGESFIASDRGAIVNAVIIDRGGLRSGRASFTLSHELGHVLLDDPGHPDDFGADTPTLLMDADASDGSAFGPRRLSLAECARAVRQSGPASPTRLLEPWPVR